MRGFATSGGVVLPVFDLAAKTGQSVSGGGGGGRGGVAFFRRFFTTAVINTAMDITRSDVLGKSAQTTSSDGQEGSEGDRGSEAIFRLRGGHRRTDAHGLSCMQLHRVRPRSPMRLRRVNAALGKRLLLLASVSSGR